MAIRMFGAILVALLFSASAAAQEPKRYEVFGGYSFFRAAGVRPDTSTAPYTYIRDFGHEKIFTGNRGWEGGFALNLNRFVALEASASGHYGGRGSYAFATQADALGRYLSILVEAETRVHSFLVGPRISAEVGRARPFAHVLVGAVKREETRGFGAVQTYPGCRDIQCDSGLDSTSMIVAETGLGTGLGGGVDVRLTKSFLLRALQVDYVRTGFVDGTQHNGKVSTGLVFAF